MSTALLALVVLCSLFGFALMWGKLLRLPFALTCLSSWCGIVCILYLAVLFGFLHVAQLALLTSGIALLVVYVRDTPRQEIRTTLLTPGVVLLFIACITIFVITRNILLIYWDEYSHWGTITKVLLATDHLPSIDGIMTRVEPVSLYLSEYPPGDALFQYFVAKPLPFAEGNLIFGRALFQVAVLLPLIALARWRDPLIYLPLIPFGFVAGYLFSEAESNWTSLLIDNILAMLFAAVFIVYFNGGRSRRAVLCTIPVVSALTIFKEVGFAFALVFATFVACDTTIAALHKRLTFRELIARRAIGCLLLFVLPVGFNYLWHLHKIRIHAQPVLDVTAERVRDRLVNPEFGKTLLTMADKFENAFKGNFPVGNARMGLDFWLLVIAILAIISIAAQDSWEKRLRALPVHAALGFAFAGYVGALFFYYLVAYSTYEAFQLAGFSRYVGSFLLTWILVSLALILEVEQRWMKRLVTIPLLLLIACFAVYLTRASAIPSFTKGVRGDDFSIAEMKVRQTVKERLASSPSLPMDSRVYSIWNGSTGLPHYMTFFELRPRPMNLGCFSLGGKRFDGDIWSCDWPIDLLKQKLQLYDYVLLGASDAIFWKQYQELFAPGSRESNASLFKVDHSNPHVLLSPVEGNQR